MVPSDTVPLFVCLLFSKRRKKEKAEKKIENKGGEEGGRQRHREGGREEKVFRSNGIKKTCLFSRPFNLDAQGQKKVGHLLTIYNLVLFPHT